MIEKIEKPRAVETMPEPEPRIYPRPTHDYVLVARDARTRTTAGGIELPEAFLKQARVGTVLAVGPGKLTPHGGRFPMSVRSGDRVVFGAYAGHDINLTGDPMSPSEETEHTIMRDEEILIVLVPEKGGEA